MDSIDYVDKDGLVKDFFSGATANNFLSLLERFLIPGALCRLKASSKGAAAGRHMNHETAMLQFTDPKAGTGSPPRKPRRSSVALP